jgi:cytidylate kinase
MIVAISREFGAGALEIARLVSERCGLELIADVATHGGTDTTLEAPNGILDAAPTDEDVVPSFFERLVAQLPTATLDIEAVPDLEEVNAHERLRTHLETALLTTSTAYDAVILGRAASFVLGPRIDVVRVFVHAPPAWRAARLVRDFRYLPSEAQATIARVDGARERYAREYYAATFSDARNYDLAIDTSRMSTAEAAELIITSVAARYQLP